MRVFASKNGASAKQRKNAQSLMGRAFAGCAESQNRTGDTRFFRPVERRTDCCFLVFLRSHSSRKCRASRPLRVRMRYGEALCLASMLAGDEAPTSPGDEIRYGPVVAGGWVYVVETESVSIYALTVNATTSSALRGASPQNPRRCRRRRSGARITVGWSSKRGSEQPAAPDSVQVPSASHRTTRIATSSVALVTSLFTR